MRCSDCSKEVKPVVALDIDGTLGDYYGHFMEFTQGYFGGWPCSPPRDTSFWMSDEYSGDPAEFGDWVCHHLEIDRRTYRDIKLAYRQGGMKRSMPVFEGAEGLSKAAREQGAEVWVTTSRPYLRLDNIDPDTRFWLDRHRIAWDHMIYGKDKYNDLARLVDPERVVAVLDDLGDMYDQALQAFGPAVPILRRNRWNERVRRPLMTGDLCDARAMIVAHVQDWRTRHHFDGLPTTH